MTLGSRALELLSCLARRGGEPVSKDEIMTIVWSGRVVEEANLNVQVSKLRQILDQHRPHGSCIQTINGFGYRFVAEVTSLDRSVLARVRPAAEGATPTAANPEEAGCSSGPAGQDERDATTDNKVVKLAIPEQLPHRVEHKPHGAEHGSFLISRLGAAGVIDPDLAAVLMELQQRLIDDYGDGAAARTLIDQVIAAYHDFIRLTGWIAHLSLTVEQELFGGEGAGTGRVTESIDANKAGIDERGAEQHLVQLRECLLPLAERRGALMRDMLAALEVFQARSRRTTTAAREPMLTECDQLSQRCSLGANPVIPAPAWMPAFPHLRHPPTSARPSSDHEYFT